MNTAMDDWKEIGARVAQMEASLREIADFAEQFIGDDEDERMYWVHQIADNAIPFTAETHVCQYCGKQLPKGCSTEFQGETGCEGYPPETPEAMHARIVTETADSMASQMETEGAPK